MLELKIGRRKRGRPVKRWIDMVEEDKKKRGVVQRDAGDREGWRRRAVKGLANDWRDRLRACIRANGRHYEHPL